MNAATESTMPTSYNSVLHSALVFEI